MSQADDCIFCRIASGQVPSQVVHQDERCVAFVDVSPQAPKHFLIVSRQHLESLATATVGDRDLLGHMLLVARKVAEQAGIANDGFRVVINSNPAAGQSVFHLHLHVLGGRAMRWPPG